MNENHLLGQEAETRAANYFIEKGFIVLERNFRYRKAEVDLIVRKKNILVAVEVKARRTDYFGLPQDFVRQKQWQRLIMAIDYYVVERNLDVDVRFDILAFVVQNGKWNRAHIENAFNYFT